MRRTLRLALCLLLAPVAAAGSAKPPPGTTGQLGDIAQTLEGEADFLEAVVRQSGCVDAACCKQLLRWKGRAQEVKGSMRPIAGPWEKGSRLWDQTQLWALAVSPTPKHCSDDWGSAPGGYLSYATVCPSPLPMTVEVLRKDASSLRKMAGIIGCYVDAAHQAEFDAAWAASEKADGKTGPKRENDPLAVGKAPDLERTAPPPAPPADGPPSGPFSLGTWRGLGGGVAPALGGVALPGLGQFLNARYPKGLLVLGVAVGSLVLIRLAPSQGLQNTGLVLLLADWALGVVDAYQLDLFVFPPAPAAAAPAGSPGDAVPTRAVARP